MTKMIHSLTQHMLMTAMAILVMSFTTLSACAQTPVTSAATIETEDKPAATAVKYRLNAGDELGIFVWKEEELSKDVVISPDGSLSYPLAGEMQAAGLTVTELKNELTRRIRGYIPKALITVSLTKVSGYRIYVLGEVQNPGEYTPGNYVTVAQALTLSKGLTEFASGSGIRVVRQTDGEEQVMKFNYGRFRKGKDLSSNIRLQSGDVVVVP